MIILYNMKKVISTLLILLLSNLTLSCETKSGDIETDAKCCAKKSRPSWCPEKPSDNEIRSGISRASKSSKAMQFARSKSENGGSKNAPQEMMSIRSNQNISMHPGFGHFWPNFCPWWRWCCRYCFYRYIAFRWPPNWFGYLMCIWRSCRKPWYTPIRANLTAAH